MGVSMDVVLRVEGVVKKYGDKIAVNNVSLSVQRGEIYGLLGPNGAGKTTLMSIIAGILDPTEGRVEVLGGDPHDREIRARIGYCPQESVVYDNLTGLENLMFYAGLYGLSGSRAKQKSEELIRFVGLEEYAKDLVKTYSGGMKKRLNFAIALVGDPDLILLDEPTTGMDPRVRRSVWELIERLRKAGKTIILATHYMEEADELSSRVAIMNLGRKVVEGTPEELKKKYGPKAVVSVELVKVTQDIIEFIKPYALEGRVVVEGNVLRVHVEDPDEASPKIVSELVKRGYKLNMLKIDRPTLEDVFLRLTGRRLIE